MLRDYATIELVCISAGGNDFAGVGDLDGEILAASCSSPTTVRDGVELYLMRFVLIATFGGLSAPALAVANYTMGPSIACPARTSASALASPR